MSFENLELIGSTYYASMNVPPDVREALEKRRLRKSLKTSDKRTAVNRARLVLAQWWNDIHEARKKLQGTPDKLTQDALDWREAMKDESLEPGLVEGLLSDQAERLEAEQGRATAARFYGVATGKLTPITPLLDRWKAYAEKSVKAKTLSMYSSDVERMAASLPNVEDLTKSKLRAWLWALAEASPDGIAEATQRRILNGVSNFWRWAQAQGLIADDLSNPTVGIELHKGAKTVTRKEFTAEQVVALHAKAVAKDDSALADLIRLAAYTGARIEELCTLKRESISPCWGFFTVKDAKSEAGNRDVPIHPELLTTMQRLHHESKDGYLIPSTARNTHGKRSDPLGKRFGRLKEDAGFGPEHVFHSIRKTVATQLENAGVAEGVAADILGHEKPTLTYGLYSGGASMAVKAKAIGEVGYPW